jgi:serine/threonine protein kinase/Tol biopolymer transport system component
MAPDPNRWRRLEALFHAAAACPPAERGKFLDRECRDDNDLRWEVESMLAQTESTRALGGVAPAAKAGDRIGVYELVTPLGSGGMGDVFRARDTRLGRDVAVKILPPAFAGDSDRLARFEREARVLASLNHPNIATIYGLERPAGSGQVGTSAIVMELVAGETLAARIDRAGALRGSDAIAIAKQIADALDAAHERGIVHRDLKPANVIVTNQGVVKVLDFGLARVDTIAAPDGLQHAGDSQAPTITLDRTHAGLVMGTAPYMSPEQARGLPVDRRTDIWAFGCVLYEMLTGRSAFGRRTISDTIASILEREPDWTAVPATTGAGTRRVMMRCLEKDPKLRMRDIGDAQHDLQGTAAGTTAAPPVEATARSRWSGALPLAVLIAAAVVGAGMAAFYTMDRTSTSGVLPTELRAARLTNYTGRQNSAAISPDGRSFAFVSDHTGTPDIWLRRVSGGAPSRVTDDAAEESDITFAPNGDSLFFNRRAGDTQDIWEIGVNGEQPRRILVGGHSAAVSPDGKTLAYMATEQPGLESITVSALDGSQSRVVAKHVPSFPHVRPAWSPDGRRIAYSRGGLFVPTNLFVIDLREGRERQVTTMTRAGQSVGQPTWLPDNRRLIAPVSAQSAPLNPQDLAVIDTVDFSVTRLTTTINDSFVDPSASEDGTRLVATSLRWLQEVWRVPVTNSDSEQNGRDSERLIGDTQSPMWTYVTRDGLTLLYNSPASGNRNLWTSRVGSPIAARQITHIEDDAVVHSSLSPDQKRVAFVSFAGGTSDIWTQNVDGSSLRQLTHDPAADSWPVWSPDGGRIVFTASLPDRRETRVMTADGASAEKMMDGFFRGDWVDQPDGSGTWIVTSDGVNAIKLVDVEERRTIWERIIPNSGGALPMFSPDRRWISVIVQLDRTRDAVAVINAETGEHHVAAVLPFHTAFRAAWVDGGKAVLVNRQDPISNVVMFERFWQP